MSEERQVTYESEGRIAFLTLNRPDQRNALSSQLLADFHVALDEFEADPTANVAVLRGAGPSFCAGFDLSRSSSSTQETAGDPWGDRVRLRGWIDLTIRIWEFPRPVIAQVHGHCLAGGILLLLAADLVVISETCAVGWPRLPMGAGFMDGAMALLIGQRRAKEISYVVGSRIKGVEAASWGLANVAVPAEQIEEEAMAVAKRISRTPRNVLEIRKAAITRAVGPAFREALLAGVEWDAIAHVDPAVRTMRRHVRDNGMKAMIESFEASDDPVTELGLDGSGSEDPVA
jgi:enoyl-CoA hydratase